jgi:hypothetical protein
LDWHVSGHSQAVEQHIEAGTTLYHAQAHVYELLDGQGRVAPIVLKAARQVALISDTQREWATGQRLAALGPGECLPCRHCSAHETPLCSWAALPRLPVCIPSDSRPADAELRLQRLNPEGET